MKRTNRQVSPETRKRMAEAKKGSKNPRYNVKVSDETRKKISESMIKYWATIPY